jgi:hypothetical protein
MRAKTSPRRYTFRNARIAWEPRDLWVGIYWTKRDYGTELKAFQLYVCILPCFPIILTWNNSYAR